MNEKTSIYETFALALKRFIEKSEYDLAMGFKFMVGGKRDRKRGKKGKRNMFGKKSEQVTITNSNKLSKKVVE